MVGRHVTPASSATQALNETCRVWLRGAGRWCVTGGRSILRMSLPHHYGLVRAGSEALKVGRYHVTFWSC